MQQRSTRWEIEQVAAVAAALGSILVVELKKSHKEIAQLMSNSPSLRQWFIQNVEDSLSLGLLSVDPNLDSPLYAEHRESPIKDD